MDQVLLRQAIPLTSYKPRCLVNALPKSGLHMAEQMIGYLLNKSEVGRGGSQWIGTYRWRGWSMVWQNLRPYLWRLSCMERGTYLMGHNGYHEDIARMLRFGNIGHVFVYRDLRDVAVSQAHHIADEGRPTWEHAHKDVYRMLGGFDEVLDAVIAGMGPYPGVCARWAEYAPWLDLVEAGEVLAVRYSDMRNDTERQAGRIILYLVQKATELLEGAEFGIEIAPADVKRLAADMAKATAAPSPTFRRGVPGGWRDEFKARHVDLFKRHDVGGWLVRLGFETDQDWG